jgi:putative heme-binding domain-containing protein
VQAGKINPQTLSPTTINFLRTHADPGLGQLAVQLLGTVPVQRPQVVHAFRPALALDGVASRGREIFVSRCLSCHGPGKEVSLGGGLEKARALTKEKVLIDILEPHREIKPWMSSTVVETKSGEVVVGVIRREDERALSIVAADGTELIFPTSNVGVLRPQPWSLMPEGLEAGMTPQNMADLIEYLVSAEVGK